MLELPEGNVVNANASGAKLSLILIVLDILSRNKTVNSLIVSSKIEYYRCVLADADAKTMYRTLNSLLNSSTGALPSCTSNESLSNNFANYFTEKVSKIRSELDGHCVLNNINNNTSLVKCTYNVCTNNSNVHMPSNNTECNRHDKCNVHVFNTFSPLDEIEVRKII